MTLKEKFDAIQAIGSKVEVPWTIRRAFNGPVQVEVLGDQVSFGEDYLSFEEARAVAAWFVEQLGGKVSWRK